MSLFKTNYNFINTFIIINNKNYKQYKYYKIKILIYINSIIISLIINFLFYYNKKMHLLYKEEGKYNFLYNCPQIIAQDLAMIFFSFLFERLINYQKNFIKIKNDLKNIKLKTEFTIDYLLGKKRITFYIIILIVNLFGWYYISCFCVVYKNTQKFILLDFLFAILFNLITNIFYCLIKVSIKFILIKSKYGKINKIIFKILTDGKFYFFIEFGLEILLVCSQIL